MLYIRNNNKNLIIFRLINREIDVTLIINHIHSFTVSVSTQFSVTGAYPSHLQSMIHMFCGSICHTEVRRIVCTTN